LNHQRFSLVKKNNNNNNQDNNNNNQYNVYSAIINGKAIARVHSGHLNGRGPASGGRQQVSQAETKA